MKIAKSMGMAITIVLQLSILSSCTTLVPATVTRAPETALMSNPKLFVQATAHREQIMESLYNAGLDLNDSLSGADYTLLVKVGRNRHSTRCGGISNVAYLLQSEGRFILVIKGRGFTGSCSPNVFDDISQKLASYAGG